MKHIKNLIMASALVVAGSVLVPAVPSIGALNPVERSCQGGSGSPVCDSAGKDELPDLIKNIVNLLLAVLGFIAVIAIIIGGIRYVTSNGDSNQTKAAKDTVLYAVIGLIVAILAYAIVNFVIDFFT